MDFECCVKAWWNMDYFVIKLDLWTLSLLCIDTIAVLKNTIYINIIRPSTWQDITTSGSNRKIRQFKMEYLNTTEETSSQKMKQGKSLIGNDLIKLCSQNKLVYDCLPFGNNSCLKCSRHWSSINSQL